VDLLGCLKLNFKKRGNVFILSQKSGSDTFIQNCIVNFGPMLGQPFLLTEEVIEINRSTDLGVKFLAHN
jgi:hypothetical protein